LARASGQAIQLAASGRRLRSLQHLHGPNGAQCLALKQLGGTPFGEQRLNAAFGLQREIASQRFAQRRFRPFAELSQLTLSRLALRKLLARQIAQ
jgi:hypothetical protein